jgi:hypothetical protein
MIFFSKQGTSCGSVSCNVVLDLTTSACNIFSARWRSYIANEMLIMFSNQKGRWKHKKCHKIYCLVLQYLWYNFYILNAIIWPDMQHVLLQKSNAYFLATKAKQTIRLRGDVVWTSEQILTQFAVSLTNVSPCSSHSLFHDFFLLNFSHLLQKQHFL